VLLETQIEKQGEIKRIFLLILHKRTSWQTLFVVTNISLRCPRLACSSLTCTKLSAVNIGQTGALIIKQTAKRKLPSDFW